MQALITGVPISTTTDPAPVLGPTGLGRLRLGMSRGGALLSGELAAISGRSDAAASGCAPYRLSEFPTSEAYQVGVCGTRGIEVICASARRASPSAPRCATPTRGPPAAAC